MSFASAARVALTLMITSVAAPVLAAGDPAAGQKVFNKCKTFHEADQAKNKVGPNLVGLFGRKAGSVTDFKYSDAMKIPTSSGPKRRSPSMSSNRKSLLPVTRWSSLV